MRRDHPDAFEVAGPLVLPAPAREVIATLSPLIPVRRLARIERVLSGRTRSVIPVLDGVDDPHNVAAILRSAEAFGTQEVHVVEYAEPFMASQRITQGTDRWLDLVRHRDASSCAAALRARGYRVYVASMEASTSLQELAAVPRVAMVFGNERDGVGSALRGVADGTYAVPMRGFAESLNVSVAAAISLHGVTQGRDGDLDPADADALRARFMMLSVPRSDEVVREAMRRRLG